MKVSPHTHAESPLTGSTLAALVGKAKELGRDYFAYTDHGHLSSALKAYSLCKADKKAKDKHLQRAIKFIPGIEVYFKDVECPITAGTAVDRCKYFSLTVYCQDQASFQELCKVVSRTDLPTIEVSEERVALWGWKELAHIAKFNTNVVLSGVHCIAGKTVLAGRQDLAELILTQLRHLFGSRLYLALLAEPWDKRYSQVVEIRYFDGTTDTILSSDQVTTDKARRIKALDLIEREGHKFIKSKSVGMTSSEVNKHISNVKLHKGFLPLPGGDASLRVNEFYLEMSKKLNLTLLVTDYAYYAEKDDKIVQTMRMEGNNKLKPNLHMKTDQEVRDYLTKVLRQSETDCDTICRNNEVWASQFDKFELKYDWHLAEAGGNPLLLAMEIIKNTGRMRWDDPVYVARLKEELQVIAKNPVKDLTSYFLPIRDVLNHYQENGLLVGPGRGSAGGSLFCYLLGITQIDPFKYDLPFNRFFSLDRIMLKELPDIDVDLEDRTLLVGEDGHSGYLYGRWGNKAAQISTRTTIRLKSAIKDANRYFHGKVQPEIEILSKGLPAPPQNTPDYRFVFGYEDDEGHHVPGLLEQSEDLKKYADSRPKEWEIVSKAMGITRAYSKHASAFVLSDIPIQDMVPTKEGNITQYEAKECEAAGLIKYDFLVINQLKDIRVCLDLINKKNNEKNTVGYFTHNGKKEYIWDLPQDESVFKSVWGGSTETCFQINTKSMIPYVMDILPGSIMDLATILALVRPGPLDFIDENTGRNMTQEYVLRKRGESEPEIKELAQLLPETFGVIAFQEQLTKIGRDLAGFPGPQAEMLRKHMAKKNMAKLMEMKPPFMEGALKKTSQEIAEKIWEQMVTFGRYGFSIIHAVEYAHITYACMFFKEHYPLEWWAAILTNATEQEITGKFWPFVKDMVSSPDINLSTDTMVVDYKNEKIRSKFGVIRGIGEATIEPIVAGRPYANIQEFVDKNVAGPSLSHKLIHVGVLDSLFPPKKNLVEKLKMYQEAVEARDYRIKLEKAEKAGKKVRALQPREAVVPQAYVDLHPMTDAAMRKAVLPSLAIDMYSLGREYSKALSSESGHVISSRGYDTMLISGERLAKLAEIDQDRIPEDVYVAATCYVIKTEEFTYPKANPTKKALKMVLDADGFSGEYVLWPEFESGQLVYPAELKKGSIATVFFRKKVGKKDLSIMGIVVETTNKEELLNKEELPVDSK